MAVKPFMWTWVLIFTSMLCLSQAKMNVCPNPPTINTVNASAYTGRWYEIGTSARFKFQRENGLICNQANYELISNSTNDNLTISVVNSGITKANFFVINAVNRIASANRNICSSLDELKEEISNLSTNIASLSNLYDSYSNSSSEAIKKIEEEAKILRKETTRMKYLIKLLSGNVSETQRVTGSLTQVQHPLEKIHSEIQKLTTEMKKVVSELEKSNSKIELSTKRITTLISQEVWDDNLPVKQKVNEITQTSLEIKSILDQTKRSIDEVSSASDSVASGDGYAFIQFRTSVFGQGVQNKNENGKFTVSFPFFGPPPSKPNYLIIGLEGKGAKGYDAALIYSCEQREGMSPDISVFIISRTATLNSNIKENFFNILKENKISLKCDNPFIYTLQDPEKCGYN